MKLFRAIFILSTVALIAALFVRYVPAAYEQTGIIGAGLVVLALGALAATAQTPRPGRLCVNVFSNLVPDAYAALKVVSRELVGFIPSVNRDTRASALALGQSLRSAVAPVNSAGADVTPAMAFPAAADQTINNVAFTIQKVRKWPFSWRGEEQYSLQQGPGMLSINQQQIAQAFRAAAAEIGSHGYGILRAGASRAYGTAGTTPFATAADYAGQTAQLRKILDDNGSPQSTRSLVVDTTAGTNARTILGGLLNANSAITAEVLTQGVLVDVNGFKLREEAQITTVTKGTAAAATTDATGYAVGSTTLTLAAVGTGTILAGDVITFAGDTNKYVVKTGNADVSAAGTIVLADPGLRVAMSAATKAITVGGNFTANLGFTQDYAILGTRLPATTNPSDMAVMREVITDPVTGISFELAAYAGYRMVTFEIAVAWGWAVENPEHGAILLG